MSMTNEFWSLFCRGRKKKITFLLITLILLMNAMFYVSLELYNTVRGKTKEPWLKSLRFGKDSYVDNSGMRVIVGHYVGGGSGGILSDDIINHNGYDPVPGAGEGGRPVQLTPREVITARDLFALHSYNILVSDKIAINRSLPDMRSTRNVQYNTENLPIASVIIVFHNEAWSTLMRNVMSIIMRSPENLLQEIILVDDASERKYLLQDLDEAVAKLEKVRLLRSEERSGLVGARLIGARVAKGDVLVFLDAHCEVTPGWLEPLLDRAGSDDVFICPHIDLLSDDTLAYTKSIDAHWGAFSWHLHFRWLFPSKDVMVKKHHDPSKPYPTPAMAGGLFAVRKSLFWRLGGYDEGMKIWGGENLELSWRAWQCGARVEITSCSRVGHIFRKHSPYKYPGGVGKVLSTNIARAATVWMDEWADFYFKFHPPSEALRDQQNVLDRVTLRQSLNCKSFQWYLNTVWPQHNFPTKDRWFGRIKNGRGACLARPPGSTGVGALAIGVQCGDDHDLDKLVVYTPDGRMMADEGLCLELDSGKVRWKACNDTSASKQSWNQTGTSLKDVNGLCLRLFLKGSDGEGVGDPVVMTKCRKAKDQTWHFERVPWQ